MKTMVLDTAPAAAVDGTIANAIVKSSAGAHPEYMLGHSPTEMRRLMVQAAVLRPITERLLRSAGVGTGMRVLDVGCGAGDVSMLAAELVGPSGAVVAIDRSPDATALARERAKKAGWTNIEFKTAALDQFADAGGFDAVVGRYVLIHQSDPSDFLRKAAALLRRHGILAFHEVKLIGPISTTIPPAPAVELGGEMIRAAAKALPHHDAGSRLVEHFFNAGLPSPRLFGELIICGGDEPAIYTWLAASFRAFLPPIARMGLVTDAAPLQDDLERSFQTAVVEARSQLECPAQICGWVKI